MAVRNLRRGFSRLFTPPPHTPQRVYGENYYRTNAIIIKPRLLLSHTQFCRCNPTILYTSTIPTTYIIIQPVHTHIYITFSAVYCAKTYYTASAVIGSHLTDRFGDLAPLLYASFAAFGFLIDFPPLALAPLWFFPFALVRPNPILCTIQFLITHGGVLTEGRGIRGVLEVLTPPPLTAAGN